MESKAEKSGTQNEKRRVLIVSYWFPPAGGIAVQRALSLVKYLPQYGCEVHVLTPTNPPSPVLDPSLLAHVPQNVKVHRAFTPTPSSETRKRIWGLISGGKKESSNVAPPSIGAPKKSSRMSGLVQRVFCPDPEVIWVPFAIRNAKRIVKECSIDSVIVTAPPFSAFLIGNALKKTFPRLRLIADFRDEWLRFFLSTFDFQKSDYIRRRAEAIERETVELSDVVVSVTLPIVSELRERYKEQPEEKFVYIPNGYDPALFKDFVARSHGTSKVVVTYVGTVYCTTSPKAYFEAIAALPQELRDRIETRFVGRVAEDQREYLESQPNVKLLGYMSQAKALKHMEETDYLLLVMSDPNFATGKIYEYLASGKPILAFSPNGGEVSRTLTNTRAGWCLDPNDKDGIYDCLLQIANRAKSKLPTPDTEAIRAYERPRLAGRFADCVFG